MNAAPFAMAGLGGGLVAELWPRAPYEVREGGGPGVVGFAFEAQEGEDAIASGRSGAGPTPWHGFRQDARPSPPRAQVASTLCCAA